MLPVALLELECLRYCAHAELNPELRGELLQKNKVHTCCNSINEFVIPLTQQHTSNNRTREA